MQLALLVLLGVSLLSSGAATTPVDTQSTSSAQSATPTNAHDALWSRLVASSNQRAAAVIAVLARPELVRTRFRHICRSQQQLQADSSSAVMEVPAACWLLQGACHCVFKSSITGVAGSFTRQQLAALHECAGPQGITYLTRDNQVKKAEGSDHKRWWTYRPPANMTLQQLQQLAASKLGAAAAAGVAAGATSAAAASQANQQTYSPPPVTASSGGRQNSARSASVSSSSSLNVTLALIQRWILAEVGLASQRQLQQQPMLNTVSPVQVRAADGAAQSADTPPVVTADAAPASSSGAPIVSSQPNGSKNQDPGIPVDPSAVAKPDIIVRTTDDSSSAARSSTATSQEPPQQPLSLYAAERANKEPGVKEQRLVTALWNLDRIDQRQLPLNSTFAYGTTTSAGTGKGVTIYVLDSGIRASHQEFQPWDSSAGSRRVTVGPDFVDGDGQADDCDGHGSHVSSTAAGRSVGVAKEANIVAVRVLDCDGAGSVSNVVAALDWVAEHAVKPAVVSLSLGVPAGAWSRPMEDSIQHITEVLGIPVVVAAGNSAKDSCQVAPGRVVTAITVAASNLPTKFSATRAGDAENLYSWSNTGACVKLFAPGVDIYGACGGKSRCAVLNDSSYSWASGTSMAAPHVTGAVAVYLESHPTATPAQVLEALLAASTTGRLTDAAMLPGTPNRLLYTTGGVTQQ